MEGFINTLVDFVSNLGIKLVIAAVLLIVGLKLCKFFVKLLDKGRLMSKMELGAKKFLLSFCSIALKILVIIAVAGYLGVPTASFVTILASAGLAVGLALQGSLLNLAGGLMILIFKPFKVGDFIDTHSDTGVVCDINVFYTVLKTLDNRHVTLPNGTLTNATIINYSSEELRRVDFVFPVAYDSDVELVKKTILEVAAAHPLALKDPEPFARLGKWNDSSLDFTARVWTKASDYWTVNFDLNEQMKAAFDKAGIEIPFPQLDVHSK